MLRRMFLGRIGRLIAAVPLLPLVPVAMQPERRLPFEWKKVPIAPEPDPHQQSEWKLIGQPYPFIAVIWSGEAQDSLRSPGAWLQYGNIVRSPSLRSYTVTWDESDVDDLPPGHYARRTPIERAKRAIEILRRPLPSTAARHNLILNKETPA